MTARLLLRVLHSFPDTIGKPGIGMTAYHQVAGLPAARVFADVWCTSGRLSLQDPHTLTTTLTIGSLRIPHRALGVERAYRLHDRRVARAVRGGAKVYGAIHCWPLGSLATIEQARAAGIPTFREVPNTHTAHAYETVESLSRELGLELPSRYSHASNPTRLAREEEEYRLADRLLVASEYAKATFVNRGYPADKLIVHQYGCDTKQFFPAAESNEARPFTALFVGRCEPRKGLHLALRAWIDSGAGDHGRFLICGRFMPGYQQLVSDDLAHPSVEVRGFVENPADVMREADVLLLPSLEEGSAIVTYEAQACGCVLVVSDASGARCSHGVHGLVHPAGNHELLVEHLRALHRDRDLLDRLRTASLARVNELTWEHAGRELAAIYAALDT